MKIRDIASVVEGSIICSPDAADTDIASACAFDMMSDVLAYVRDQGVLITGLVNPQVVRTAVMVDIACIVFIVTDMSTYEAAGKLYAAGLAA